jgi:hypothetical protein
MNPLSILQNLQSSANYTGRMGAAGRPRDPMSVEVGGPDNYTEQDMTMDNAPEPYWGDSYESQAGRRETQAEDQQSIALDALRRAADEARSQETQDLAAEDADYMAHGYDRAMAQANVEGNVGDVTSENAAERSFLPWAAKAGERDFERASSQADVRYNQPAMTRAQGDIGAARATAAGRVGVEGQRQGGMAMEALYKALDEFQAQNKRAATPEEVATFKQVYGVQ